MEKGQRKSQEFAQDLQNNSTTFYEPIKKNRVDFLSQDSDTAKPSKQKLVKEDCQP